MELMTSCCYFFGLQTGCILIGVLETFLGVLQVYFSCFKIYYGEELLSTSKHMHQHHVDAESLHKEFFDLTIGSATVFNSVLLILGSKFERKKCLLLWLYVTLMCIIVFIFYSLIADFVPEHLLLDALSVGIEIYFWCVVLSFYMQLQMNNRSTDFEVLYTNSDAMNVYEI